MNNAAVGSTTHPTYESQDKQQLRLHRPKTGEKPCDAKDLSRYECVACSPACSSLHFSPAYFHVPIAMMNEHTHLPTRPTNHRSLKIPHNLTERSPPTTPAFARGGRRTTPRTSASTGRAASAGPCARRAAGSSPSSSSTGTSSSCGPCWRAAAGMGAASPARCTASASGCVFLRVCGWWYMGR